MEYKQNKFEIIWTWNSISTTTYNIMLGWSSVLPLVKFGIFLFYGVCWYTINNNIKPRVILDGETELQHVQFESNFN